MTMTQAQVLDEFRAAGLDGEVGLGEGDFLFSRISILGDEVAGVTGEHDVLDLTLGAGADFDHFPDVRKMVLNRMTGDLTRGLGLGNHGLKILPFVVA